MASIPLAGCTAPEPGTMKPMASAPPASSCPVPAGDALAPEAGVLAGVNLDWGEQTLEQYAATLGRAPAVAVSFAPFPFSDQDAANVEAAKDQVRAHGGILLLTLEPHDGLAAVTQAATDELAGMLDGYNRQGVPVIVRFAHEMNGSWYPWGQQPQAYKAAFGRVADSVHRLAPGSAMMWAPNYGGGYPFTGGQYQARPTTIAHHLLDTDHDGNLDNTDDPYAPYYPGDEAVDWVGMSLYHWGNTYPWGANEVPEDGKFLGQLTGTYVGAGGDDTAVPDFYAQYGQDRNKPVAIPETAALYVPSAGGEDEEGQGTELAVKQAWWRQLFDPTIPEDYPQLKMVNWFEWAKHEVEVDGTVDWRATGTDAITQAYRADLPDWYHYTGQPTTCAPSG
jgi:hypothetical protein